MDKTVLDKAVQMALDVRKNAHAPYSNFRVGAAVITKKGNIYTGVNVENSSYGATVCAERIAIFKAVSEGEKEFTHIVVASALNGKAAYPCGMCRQVISDFSRDVKIVLVNSDTKEIEEITDFEKIFPFSFDF